MVHGTSWYIMVHHGTSWYIMVLCVPYLVSFGDYLRGKIESKISVKCALATACCLGPLGKPLDVCPFCNGCKKGISRNPRSEAPKPACLSWCSFCSYFALLHTSSMDHKDFLCYQRALIFACKRCNRLNPSYLYCALPNICTDKCCYTPKTKIAPKKTRIENVASWDGVQNGAIGEFWGVHLFALYNPIYFFDTNSLHVASGKHTSH